VNPAAPPPPLSTVLAVLRGRLSPVGLDLLGAGEVGAFNATLSEAQARYRLPDLGHPRHSVIVIGHGRDIWAPFCRALAASPALSADPDPFDRWTAASISAAVAEALPPGVARDLRHVWEGPPRMVAMQALAVHVGLGVRGPAGLVVDPERGPWIAFRAAVIVALPFARGPAPGGSSGSAPGSSGPAAPSGFAPGPAAPSDPTAPCGTCRDRPCVPALERARAATSGGLAASLGPAWAPWLALRDACPVGRDARYSERQVRYHYARDRAALREDPEKTED
jgi:hypothetical protein